MILYNDSYETVWSVLDGEQSKVKYQLQRFENETAKLITRRYLRSRHLPFAFTKEYTVPDSKNTYVLWVHAEMNDSSARFSTKNGAALAVTQRDGSRNFFFQGKNLLKEVPGSRRNQLFGITAHCLSRYRTRYVTTSNPSPNELLAEFATKNVRELQRIPLNWANENHEAYENGTAYIVSNGIILGCYLEMEIAPNRWIGINQFNTFLPEKMLRESQKSNIQERFYESVFDTVRQFVENASDEEMHLVLSNLFKP